MTSSKRRSRWCPIASSLRMKTEISVYMASNHESQVDCAMIAIIEAPRCSTTQTPRVRQHRKINQHQTPGQHGYLRMTSCTNRTPIANNTIHWSLLAFLTPAAFHVRQTSRDWFHGRSLRRRPPAPLPPPPLPPLTLSPRLSGLCRLHLLFCWSLLQSAHSQENPT